MMYFTSQTVKGEGQEILICKHNLGQRQNVSIGTAQSSDRSQLRHNVYVLQYDLIFRKVGH